MDCTITYSTSINPLPSDKHTNLLFLISRIKSKKTFYKLYYKDGKLIQHEQLSKEYIRNEILTKNYGCAAFKWCRYIDPNSFSVMLPIIKNSSRAALLLVLWNPSLLEEYKSYITHIDDVKKILLKYPDLTDYYISNIENVSGLLLYHHYFPMDEDKIRKQYNECIVPNAEKIYENSNVRDYELWLFGYTMREREKYFLKAIEKEHKIFLKNIEKLIDKK